jgi:hypothetical protein
MAQLIHQLLVNSDAFLSKMFAVIGLGQPIHHGFVLQGNRFTSG